MGQSQQQNEAGKKLATEDQRNGEMYKKNELLKHNLVVKKVTETLR